LVRRFSATDKKFVLKAFAMVCGLLDNLLFTFIVILLVVFLLLVMVSIGVSVDGPQRPTVTTVVMAIMNVTKINDSNSMSIT